MKFSIIIPVYNGEEHLERALKSVLTQKYEDYEIIIVNDGSIDGTEEICKKYIKKYNNIKYFYQSNMGVSTARNYGIMQSSGDYLYFLDADDALKENMLKDSAKTIEKYKPQLIIFGYEIIKGNGTVIKYRANKKEMLLESNEQFFDKYLHLEKENDLNSLWNKIYNRDFIKKNSFLFPIRKIGEDAMFNYQLFCYVDRIAISPNIYYSYTYDRQESAMNQKYNNKIIEKLEVLEARKKLFNLKKINIPSYYFNERYIELLFREYKDNSDRHQIINSNTSNLYYSIKYNRKWSIKTKLKYVILKIFF